MPEGFDSLNFLSKGRIMPLTKIKIALTFSLQTDLVVA